MTAEFSRNSGSQGWAWAKHLQECPGLWAKGKDPKKQIPHFGLSLRSPSRDGFAFEIHQFGHFSLIEATQDISPKSSGGLQVATWGVAILMHRGLVFCILLRALWQTMRSGGHAQWPPVLEKRCCMARSPALFSCPHLSITACHTQPASQPRLGQVLLGSLVSVGQQPRKDGGVNKSICVPRPAAHPILALQTRAGFTGAQLQSQGPALRSAPTLAWMPCCHHLES